MLSYNVNIRECTVSDGLLSAEVGGLSERMRRFFAWGSDLTLGAYLVSWIFDMIVYGKLNSHVVLMDKKMLWMPVTVITVLVCSLLLSQVIDWLYRLTVKKWVDRASAAAGKDK